jgi:hypothetical protein
MFNRLLNWFREQARPRPFDGTPRTGWRGVVWGRGLRGDGWPAISWASVAAIGITAVALFIASRHWLLAGVMALMWIPLVAFSIARLIRAIREDDFI